MLCTRIGIFLFLSGIVAILGIYIYAFFSPRLELTNLGKIFLYDNQEQLVFQGNQKNEWVPLSEMSDYLVQAVLSVEDKKSTVY